MATGGWFDCWSCLASIRRFRPRWLEFKATKSAEELLAPLPKNWGIMGIPGGKANPSIVTDSWVEEPKIKIVFYSKDIR